MTTPTELAHRTNSGIDVYLFWEERTNRITVDVLDERTGDNFELEVDGRHALEAFNHPYAYAARINRANRGAPALGGALRGAGRDSHVPAINPRRSDHARTDR